MARGGQTNRALTRGRLIRTEVTPCGRERAIGYDTINICLHGADSCDRRASALCNLSTGYYLLLT